MCEPTTMFLAATAVSAGSQLVSGFAGMAAGEREAQQYGTQQIQIANAASQEQRARSREFDQVRERNAVAVMLSNLDASSFEVIEEANRRSEGEDLTLIADDAEIRKGEARIAASNARQRGRMALLQGVLGAAGTAASARFTFSQVAPPSPRVVRSTSFFSP